MIIKKAIPIIKTVAKREQIKTNKTMNFNFNPEHTFFTSDTHFNHANIIKCRCKCTSWLENSASIYATTLSFALKAATRIYGSSSDMSIPEITTQA